MSYFIANCHIKNNRKGNILCLKGFRQVAFEFITSIFKGDWNVLKAGSSNKSFHDMIKEEFTTKVPTKPLGKKSDRFPLSKSIEFTNIPLPQVFLRSSKEDMAKSKFHDKKSSDKPTNKPTCTYAQASSVNVQDILKLKENFSNLSDKKIKDIYKTMNNLGNPKLCIIIMTKGPLYKQIIIPMDNNNIKKFVVLSSKYVINLNCTLKSNVIIDFL